MIYPAYMWNEILLFLDYEDFKILFIDSLFVHIRDCLLRRDHFLMKMLLRRDFYILYNKEQDHFLSLPVPMKIHCFSRLITRLIRAFNAKCGYFAIHCLSTNSDKELIATTICYYELINIFMSANPKEHELYHQFHSSDPEHEVIRIFFAKFILSFPMVCFAIYRNQFKRYYRAPTICRYDNHFMRMHRNREELLGNGMDYQKVAHHKDYKHGIKHASWICRMTNPTIVDCPCLAWIVLADDGNGHYSFLFGGETNPDTSMTYYLPCMIINSKSFVPFDKYTSIHEFKSFLDTPCYPCPYYCGGGEKKEIISSYWNMVTLRMPTFINCYLVFCVILNRRLQLNIYPHGENRRSC
eukprot:472392_1